MATLDHEAELERAGANVDSAWSRMRFYARRYPLGAIGGLIVVLFVLTAIFAPWITSYDPTSTDSSASLARPFTEHIFGADFMGRDLFARIIYGARVSLWVGIGSTVLGCAIG
ncbi:MAG: ABC transporter permease, partial [Hyphomicrobiaceae bacterium]